MKKKAIIEIKIEEVEFPSKGIGYYEGKKVYVKNGIVGQVVKVYIKKVRKEYAEGKLLEVISRSERERDSFCPHFGLCGGCANQTVAYDDQVQLKEKLVKKLLDDAGIKGYEFEGIEKSPEVYEYRNKMEYSFGDETKGGILNLGMHKRGSFQSVVTVDECKLVDNDFNKILKTALDYFREKEVPHYNAKTHKGFLRHFIVRKAKGTEEILVNLVTSTQMDMDMSELVEKTKSLDLKGKLVGYLHTFNDNLSDCVTNERLEILYGRDYFYEEILGLKFKISAFSFFQTNPLGAEKLYSIAMDYMGDAKDKIVYDLYCGTGTIGQIASTRTKEVYGIELIEEAVEAANENAKLNGLTNCHFIAGDVFEKLDELAKKPEVIIVDPPRVGINPKALKKILKYKCKEIVYVSCNPKSLAENLADMQESGYKVKKVRCMDMFPHTPHVETVVQIEKA
ncbi:23S rRNA (uracil(1939)-C(5))-methyltransferase RlmD [Anaeromicrobium sediminis]|uniref:23S rRNA (Uracil(1939)-C(5))-methyltransferase RlmD n=1 Tax=Anaeromicrobium sediminis TaxID=1478221 RepID=A0A267MPE7_9FIRM|nr:23S rRNA (uracil(1939)-C(5))-methyltransferase RlmD [Anaeromicrobium sediminis]PAB60673.1 23S rRNA (uracil(1939)-C(5))-methyltransferase RlmD [Anaeromicrobium sediminis]